MEYTTFPRFPPTFPHCTVETCGKAVFPSNPVLRIHKFFSFHGLQNPASLVILNLPAPTRLRQAIRAPAAGDSRRRRSAAGLTAIHRGPRSGCASQGSACREARAAALRKNGSAGICFLRRTLKPVCLQPRYRATKIRMCEKSPGFWGNCDYYIILEAKVP